MHEYVVSEVTYKNNELAKVGICSLSCKDPVYITKARLISLCLANQVANAIYSNKKMLSFANMPANARIVLNKSKLKASLDKTKLQVYFEKDALNYAKRHLAKAIPDLYNYTRPIFSNSKGKYEVSTILGYAKSGKTVRLCYAIQDLATKLNSCNSLCLITITKAVSDKDFDALMTQLCKFYDYIFIDNAHLITHTGVMDCKYYDANIILTATPLANNFLSHSRDPQTVPFLSYAKYKLHYAALPKADTYEHTDISGTALSKSESLAKVRNIVNDMADDLYKLRSILASRECPKLRDLPKAYYKPLICYILLMGITSTHSQGVFNRNKHNLAASKLYSSLYKKALSEEVFDNNAFQFCVTVLARQVLSNSGLFIAQICERYPHYICLDNDVYYHLCKALTIANGLSNANLNNTVLRHILLSNLYHQGLLTQGDYTPNKPMVAMLTLRSCSPYWVLLTDTEPSEADRDKYSKIYRLGSDLRALETILDEILSLRY